MKKVRMDCNQVRRLLNAYVDGELDLVNSLEIEAHLRGCASCSRQYQELAALHAATSNPALVFAAPAGLEKRIHTSLQKAYPMPRPRFPLAWPWLAPAVGLAAILLILGIFFGRSLFTPSQQVLLAQAVETAHVRSLIGEHLTDVASTDQHTVKPWFDGKLDFSPPVVDPAAQGYPLIGGRLDYLDNHQVAALVYQRNKHIINLFVWPSSGGSSGLSASTYNGYNLYQWNQAGMTFWAVSDLEKGQLKTFVELVQAGIQ
jgi:anti-sigma factor RsiW